MQYEIYVEIDYLQAPCRKGYLLYNGFTSFNVMHG